MEPTGNSVIMELIKRIIKNRTVLNFTVIVILLFIFLRQCNLTESLRNELEITQQTSNRNLNNYKASQDSIRFEKNKYDRIVAVKSSYEYTIDELKGKNRDIVEKYREALNVADKTKRINSILSAQINIKDSIIDAGSNITILNDSSLLLSFSDEKNWDKYNWRRFNGTINILKDSTMDIFSIVSSNFKIDHGVGLKAAIIEDEGISSLKITTNYPGVTFTDIENINIVNDRLNRRQTKRGGFSIGIGVGYGINLNNNQVISTGPSIGIGLYYSPTFLRF